jgi:leucyl-tRNA synthetase
MPQWAGSSWYFLRYIDNKNNDILVNKEKAAKYLPVDMYIGGIEHAVLHLLYSRFYTKFLYDLGYIDFEEPFAKLFNQGMITGKNGVKMSKTRGKTVSPDDLVRDYGCDSLRLYELFVGPPELDSEWDDRGIEGVYRFLSKFYNLVMENKDKNIKPTTEMLRIRHKLIYDITQRLNNFSLNTVVSGFMEYNNKMIELARNGGIDKDTLITTVILLSPFTPHIAEELYKELGGTESVFKNNWPVADENLMADNEKEVAIQVNGKTKKIINMAADITQADAIAAGKAALGDRLVGTIMKEIYVPGRIVNIVIK